MTVQSEHSAMQRALRFAALGRHASPNPMVGCVVIDAYGGKVGEGYHPYPGQPHAEIFALRAAGQLAKDGTAFVTLEPCSHYGRTPPCADALIVAGIKKVVVASVDPDQRVSGRGIDRLRSAGVLVETGLLDNSNRRLNAAYFHHRNTGKPYVTVKIASTLDGKTATASGDSRWITSATTRRWVHRQLRDRNDAIMVGVGTILKDDPSLTTRLTGIEGRNPYRIIVDSHLRTPLNSQVVKLSANDGKTIICCLAQFAQKRQQYESLGVTVVPVSAASDGRVDLRALLETLGTRGDVIGVLIEGGATLIASAIEFGIVNRYIATVAPKLIGGALAPGAIGGSGLASTMEYAIRLSRWKVRRSAADLVIDAHLFEH